jgi:predicted acetyltransferase
MNSPQRLELVWPAVEHLSGYVQALQQGWSPDNLRRETALDELERIAQNPERFIAEQVDRDASGPPVTLPDGSIVRRLPGYKQWLWDGEFCGVIGFRWQPGTADLPPHVLGHIGFSVVPWKRHRGYATRALGLFLTQARKEGLPHVELTTDPENAASQRVIAANGGQFVERFTRPEVFGGADGLRFRILLRNLS